MFLKTSWPETLWTSFAISKRSSKSLVDFVHLEFLFVRRFEVFVLYVTERLTNSKVFVTLNLKIENH
jgi:hypothetical protein